MFGVKDGHGWQWGCVVAATRIGSGGDGDGQRWRQGWAGVTTWGGAATRLGSGGVGDGQQWRQRLAGVTTGGV